MFICRIAEGVHGQRKVGNPWSKTSAFTNGERFNPHWTALKTSDI